MKKLNKLSLLILAAAVLAFIINLVFYNKLPDQVGMQVSLSGDLNNFVPKVVFLFMTPVFLMADFIYSIMSEKQAAAKSLLVGILIFAANLMIMFKNLM